MAWLYRCIYDFCYIYYCRWVATLSYTACCWHFFFFFSVAHAIILVHNAGTHDIHGEHQSCTSRIQTKKHFSLLCLFFTSRIVRAHGEGTQRAHRFWHTVWSIRRDRPVFASVLPCPAEGSARLPRSLTINTTLRWETGDAKMLVEFSCVNTIYFLQFQIVNCRQALVAQQQ